MTQQVIGRGAVANDGTGDNARVFTGKINDNFTELYKRAVVSASDPTASDDSSLGYQAGITTWFSSASGRLFILRDATPGAAVWGEIKGTMARESAHFYSGRKGTAPASSGALVANTLYGSLYRLERRITFDAMSMRCTVGVSGASVLPGIYAMNDTGPTALLVQPAAAGSAATGNSDVIMALASSFTLDEGTYLWASLIDAAVGFQSIASADPDTQAILGANNTPRALGASGNHNAGISVARSFALGLPTTFPAWSRNYSQPIPTGCLRAV